MIKNIVFDMGNVLVKFDINRYLERYATTEHDRNILRNEVFRSIEWVKLDRGIISEKDAIASITARLSTHLCDPVTRLFNEWHTDLPPLREMEPLVCELKAAGYGIYLLSNTSAAYHTFRNFIPALQHFDGEFISAECHLLKPDIAIYKLFCEKFKLIPSECYFIDDMPINVEGAMQIGMNGCVYFGDVLPLREALLTAGVLF